MSRRMHVVTILAVALGAPLVAHAEDATKAPAKPAPAKPGTTSTKPAPAPAKPAPTAAKPAPPPAKPDAAKTQPTKTDATTSAPAIDPLRATPEATALAGLTLIRDGKFNDWIKDYCSKDKKCFNEQASAALKRYNLPAMQRRSIKCIVDGKLTVKRTDTITPDKELKLFIQCEVTAMPVPIWLIKEADGWRFSNI